MPIRSNAIDLKTPTIVRELLAYVPLNISPIRNLLIDSINFMQDFYYNILDEDTVVQLKLYIRNAMNEHLPRSLLKELNEAEIIRMFLDATKIILDEIIIHNLESKFNLKYNRVHIQDINNDVIRFIITPFE